MVKFDKLLQIAVIVEDVDASVKEYEKLGIGPWSMLDFDKTTIPGMMIDGKPGELKFKGAMCQFSGIEIELIQPVSEGIFTEWLREQGQGVHHIAFIPREGFEGFMQEFKGNGNKNLIEVLNGDGDRGFVYLDTIKQLGFYAEIHKGQPG